MEYMSSPRGPCIFPSCILGAAAVSHQATVKLVDKCPYSIPYGSEDKPGHKEELCMFSSFFELPMCGTRILKYEGE